MLLPTLHMMIGADFDTSRPLRVFFSFFFFYLKTKDKEKKENKKEKEKEKNKRIVNILFN